MVRLTSKQLSQILEEVAGFEVELEEDPTLPHLGVRYLNERVALCRKYLNRVTYYMQVVGKQTKDLTVEVRHMELDLDLKLSQKLADDEIVRKQPSIEDRRAVANMMLRQENDNLATLRVTLLDTSETFKIIRMKHQDLVRTSSDIRMQRQFVKDDMDARLAGGVGYDKPQVRQDGSIPGGMASPVSPGIVDPRDILDPDKRPDDMPSPVDDMHAQQIVDFLNQHSPTPPSQKSPSTNPPAAVDPMVGGDEIVI